MNPLDDLFAALCEIGPLTGNDERDKKRTRAKEVIMRWCIATADTYGQVERRVSWRAAVPDVIDELVRQAPHVSPSPTAAAAWIRRLHGWRANDLFRKENPGAARERRQARRAEQQQKLDALQAKTLGIPVEAVVAERTRRAAERAAIPPRPAPLRERIDEDLVEEGREVYEARIAKKMSPRDAIAIGLAADLGPLEAVAHLESEGVELSAAQHRLSRARARANGFAADVFKAMRDETIDIDVEHFEDDPAIMATLEEAEALRMFLMSLRDREPPKTLKIGRKAFESVILPALSDADRRELTLLQALDPARVNTLPTDVERQARNVALDRARKEIEQLTIRLGDRFSSVKLYFADLCARRDRLLVRSGP